MRYKTVNREVVLTDSGGVRKLSSCLECGCGLLPRCTSSGKIYRIKFCPDCRLKRQRARAFAVISRPGHYDSFRKHFTHICKACGKEFSVKGLSSAEKKLTCSPSCASEIYRRNMLNRPEHLKALHKDKTKWIKMFERTRTALGTAIGPDNCCAVHTCLKSPDNQVYDITNVTHFVRSNQHLFLAEDVVWRSAKSRSLVTQVDFRPSMAVGCLKCKAQQGLLTVSSGRKPSWKGWRVAT